MQLMHNYSRFIKQTRNTLKMPRKKKNILLESR